MPATALHRSESYLSRPVAPFNAAGRTLFGPTRVPRDGLRIPPARSCPPLCLKVLCEPVDSCLKLECAEKVLRFAVGTRVECRVDGLGGWHKGRVVKHWYRESHMPPGLFLPYQIELDREFDRGKLICARHDDDRMIRRAID